MALAASNSSLVFITSGVMGAKVAWPLLTSAVHPPLPLSGQFPGLLCTTLGSHFVAIGAVMQITSCMFEFS